MSITAKQRDDIDESDFAGPDRSFPINTQAHVDAAAHLVGKAADPEAVKRRVIAIAKRKGFTLPEAWKDKEVGMADEMVKRRARIFRFGHYPKKDWGITADQFVAVNGATGTIPIGFDPIGLKHYEGKKSVLDGKTGKATYSVVGNELFADIEWPSLFNEVAEENGLGFSGCFSRATSELRKVDLVDRPHVADAVLLADDPDTVIVFDDDEPSVEFDDDAPDMAQMGHDLASHCMPGLCSKKRVHGAGGKETDAERGLRMIHDHHVVEGGAYCPGMDQHHGEVGMADDIDIEELQAENERLLAENATLKGKNVTLADEETPREKKLREQVEAMAATIIKKDAVTFADSVTKGDKRKAYPAERKAIIEGYERSATIDAKLGDDATVTFSDDKGASQTGSHLDAFRASFDVRPVIATKPEGTVGFADLDAEPPSGDAKAEEAAREKRREENRKYALAHNSNGVAK